jgi:DHA2 family multidrug resistance protein-like MFS transporter
LLFVLGPLLLPEFRDPAAGRPDVPSALLSVAAVLAVIYGLKRIAADGTGWLAASSIAAGLALGAAFVHRQRNLRDPLIDLRLFRVPAFSASIATYMLATFVVFGPYLFIAQYLQLVLGLSPMKAGLWSMPLAIAFVVGSMLSPVIARRVRPAVMMGVGLVVAAAGFAVLSRANGLAAVVASTVVFSVGLSPVVTLANDLILGAAPPERAGAAAAISETCSELGGALGIAVLGSIGTAIYRRAMAGAPDGAIPHEAAVAARDTLGGAVAAAGQWAPGAALLDTARNAFTHGLQVAAQVSAVIVLGTAVLVTLSLRHVPSAGGSADH